jgi:hypothetical protein
VLGFCSAARCGTVKQLRRVTGLSLLLLPLLLLLPRLLLVLLLSLSLLPLHLLLHAVVILLDDLTLIADFITRKVQPCPLIQSIFDIAHPLWVEHMAGRSERLAAFGSIYALDKGREEEDHVTALVHDGGAAEGAGDFAGQLVLDALLGRLIPAKVMNAIGEVNVRFVEDGCPLKRCL